MASRERQSGSSRSGRGQNMPGRDEEGRFMNSGPEGSRGGRSMSQSQGGSRHGGWYGDPEGHAEAARQRWGSESDRSYAGGRYQSEDYDDRPRSASGPARGQGRGWFGDPEGHSQAARQRWEEEGSRSYAGSRTGGGRYQGEDYDDRSRSSFGGGEDRGWTSTEGYAQATGQRWEEEEDRSYAGSRAGGGRYQGEYDEDRSPSRSSPGSGRSGGGSSYSSRSRMDQGRDQGHGGWFGDPQRHSEAARRGWEDRR